MLYNSGQRSVLASAYALDVGSKTMKNRRISKSPGGTKPYQAIVLVIALLLVWQLTKLNDDYVETSSHSAEVKAALEPYLYHPPDEFPEGIKANNFDYSNGYKEGWFTMMRTIHYSPYTDERPFPPYQIPEKYFVDPDSTLTDYEKGFRDGCFSAEDNLHRISFYSPKALRKDMRRAFSVYVTRETPDSVINHLKEIGYDFDT